MPEVSDDMPQAPSVVSSPAKATYLADETNALHTVCVTKPLPELLPGLFRIDIPYPRAPRWRLWAPVR
jgi:hypothetical protein